MLNYVGLDIATRTGIAWYETGSGVIKTHVVKGTPIDQWDFICELLSNLDAKVEVVLEKPVYFRNAVTARSLIERYGYLKWQLMADYVPIIEVVPTQVRRFIGAKTKQGVLEMLRGDDTRITHDHADAAALVLFGMGVRILPIEVWKE